MKRVVFYFIMLLSINAYSQNGFTGEISYNERTSTVMVEFSNLRILPDSILSINFKTLMFQYCNSLNLSKLFCQLANKKELHTLYIRHCNISCLPKELADIPNLKKMILDNNIIKKIECTEKKMVLEYISLSYNRIGGLSYKHQAKFFKSLYKLVSPSSSLLLNLSSNGLDSLPNIIGDMNLYAINISNNNFKQVPYVLCEIVNNGDLRRLDIDHMQSLLNPSNSLFRIQNKWSRSYVNIDLVSFMGDTFNFSDEDVVYLNKIYKAIHFNSVWGRARRYSL